MHNERGPVVSHRIGDLYLGSSPPAQLSSILTRPVTSRARRLRRRDLRPAPITRPGAAAAPANEPMRNESCGFGSRFVDSKPVESDDRQDRPGRRWRRVTRRRGGHQPPRQGPLARRRPSQRTPPELNQRP
ncbi:hypothetical protein EVAR_33055_1 [Eumeta japonica]|uniref:Uncharacterized protein n=1 Tax=Eumeta variegata TaxID=151549 RepID=A0A4C1WSW8_EUMVA|nr:hypothetical protein EVAR_33055_1 [Eumeta japonica]